MFLIFGVTPLTIRGWIYFWEIKGLPSLFASFRVSILRLWRQFGVLKLSKRDTGFGLNVLSSQIASRRKTYLLPLGASGSIYLFADQVLSYRG